MGALSDGEAEGRPAFRLGRGDATGDAHAGLAGTGTSSSGRTRHLGLGLAGLRPRPSTALSVSRCSCEPKSWGRHAHSLSYASTHSPLVRPHQRPQCPAESSAFPQRMRVTPGLKMSPAAFGPPKLTREEYRVSCTAFTKWFE